MKKVRVFLAAVALLALGVSGESWAACEVQTTTGAYAHGTVLGMDICDSTGAQKISVVSSNPCIYGTKQFIPINISTATTTEITANLAGAATHYYVCFLNIGPVAAATNVALVDDDTDNCASVTSGLAGGITANSGWNISANGGLVLGSGIAPIARTNGTNRVLCLMTSAAVQTSGSIVVVAAP